MSSSSSRDRWYDEATRQYVRWSNRRGCYVGEKDDRSFRDPQKRPSAAPAVGSSQPVSIPTSASNRATVQEVTSGMRSIAVGSPPPSNTQSRPAAAGGQGFSAQSTGYTPQNTQQRSTQQPGYQNSSSRTTTTGAPYVSGSSDQRAAQATGQAAGAWSGASATTTSEQRNQSQNTQQASSSGRGRVQGNTGVLPGATQGAGARTTGEGSTGLIARPAPAEATSRTTQTQYRTTNSNAGLNAPAPPVSGSRSVSQGQPSQGAYSSSRGATSQYSAPNQAQGGNVSDTAQGYNVSTSGYMPSASSTRQVTQGASQSSTNRQAGLFNATITDPQSGLQTQWEVSGITPFRDPENEDSNRILNFKRIRQVENRPTVPSNASNKPEEDFKIGRVIEVLLVPPEDVDLISSFTPTQNPPLAAGEIRLRRFVIIRNVPPRKFEALAIKTYYGRGVSAPGVIKSHHGIIYTHKFKAALPEEAPRPSRSGHMETGMQRRAIRVISADRGRALDSMSRLDYADRYEFDWDVTNIRVFGQVHSDSLAPLFLQYNAVWTNIKTAVQGASHDTSTSYAQSTTTTGLTIPAPINTATSSTRATTGSARTANLSPAGQLLQRFAAPNSGPCTTDQMSTMIKYLQDYAAREGLDAPTVKKQELQDLARDAARRANYIQLIKDTWRRARLARGQEESSDEESEDEESEDDE